MYESMMRGGGGMRRGGGHAQGHRQAEHRPRQDTRGGEEAAEAAKGPSLFDPYFNIVEVKVYGQARFYNPPPDEPAAEPSLGETATARPPRPNRPRRKPPRRKAEPPRRAGQGRGANRAGQGRAGQDRARQGRTGQGRARQGRTGQGRRTEKGFRQAVTIPGWLSSRSQRRTNRKCQEPRVDVLSGPERCPSKQETPVWPTPRSRSSKKSA